MSAQDPTLTFVSGTATSAKFRFLNNNATTSGVNPKTFFLEYTTQTGLNTSSRVPLVASDASGDIIVANLDSLKSYLFELTQTGSDISGVYVKRSSVVPYLPAGPPGAPVISNLIRNTDGGCDLYVTPGSANGGTGIKYAFHSQNTKHIDIPPIKHWALYDASSSNVITLTNGNLVFSFADLSNGDVYEFWVNTINSIGECSEDSNTVVVTPTNCPGAVRQLAQVSGDASATISWKKPLDEILAPTTSATAIKSYTMVINNNVTKVDVSKLTFVLDASGNYGDLSWNKTDASNNPHTVYEYKVTGLTNFTPYTVTVYASSDKGAGLERSVQVLPYSSDLNVNGSLKAYPGNTVIDVSWNAPSSTFFDVLRYNADIYSVSDLVTSKGVIKQLTIISAKSQQITYDMSSNGAINGYHTQFAGLTNGTLYKIVITVVLKNGTSEIICTLDKDVNGIFSMPFTSASAITGYSFNSYSTLAILNWDDVTSTGGYPIIRYDVSYVDVSGIVQKLSTRESTITIVGLKNDISYGVYITPITGPVSTFNGTNVVKSATLSTTTPPYYYVTGAQNSSNSFGAVSSSSQNVVVNSVNTLSYKYIDATNVSLIWKQPSIIITGGVYGSTSKVLSYSIYQTNSQGFINSAASPASVNFDPSANSLADISSNIVVPPLQSGYLGVITTVAYTSVSTSGTLTNNITSNIQYIPYSTGAIPTITSIDISNVLIPKSATTDAYTQGTVTISTTNNNGVPTSVICFAPDIKGSSITGAIKSASSLPNADSVIVSSADGSTSTVVFVYLYAVNVVVSTAANIYGSGYLSKTA